jgi:hypothetical protein
MRKLVVPVLVLSVLVSRPAHAQIPVTDVAGLVQLVNIVRNTQQTIELMREEYQTIQRIAKGYGGSLGPYRIPALPPLNHDTAKYEYARQMLEALNTGDPYGEKYATVVRKAIEPGGLFDTLPPEARKVMEVAFGSIEIADSIATMGIHESAQARGYAQRIAQLVKRLQDDVTAPGAEMHEVTAIADKLAVAGLTETRLDQNSNQITSTILEQQLAKNKRARDAAAAHWNMGLNRMIDHGQSTDALVGNATTALQNWSLR